MEVADEEQYMETGGVVLAELADLFTCASNDFHLMHLNYVGAESDSMHKEVLKEYYEQAAETFDSLAEFARCFNVVVENPSEAASRISYKMCEGIVDKEQAVARTNLVLKTICESLLSVYKILNENQDCYMSVGVCNYLQGQMEYWMKEEKYFNKMRMPKVEVDVGVGV